MASQVPKVGNSKHWALVISYHEERLRIYQRYEDDVLLRINSPENLIISQLL